MFPYHMRVLYGNLFLLQKLLNYFLGFYATVYMTDTIVHFTIPVAALSKSWVCGRSLAGIAGSSPAGIIDVCLFCVCCQVKISVSG